MSLKKVFLKINKYKRMCFKNTGHLRWSLKYIETDFAKLQKTKT